MNFSNQIDPHVGGFNASETRRVFCSGSVKLIEAGGATRMNFFGTATTEEKATSSYADYCFVVLTITLFTNELVTALIVTCTLAALSR